MKENDAQSPLVQLTGIEKRYPGVRALDGVDFDVLPGEIHALAGENGAGKSTLMKILGGVIHPTAGEIAIRGQRVRMAGPRDALAHGISLVHQELVAAPMLSVTENILLGRLPQRYGRVDWSTAHRRSREVLDRLGVEISEKSPMNRLGLGQQQLVEIARALTRDTSVLVLDEASANLGQAELQTLYDVVRSLRADGVGIVYISHRLGEVLDLSDRVTVLKDGQLQKTVQTRSIDQEQLVTLMTGRELAVPKKSSPSADAATLLEVRNLSLRGGKGPISLSVKAGEIVGLAGLVGSGRTELARAIIGADPSQGCVLVHGELFRRRSPRRAKRRGIAYLPEDRKDQGLLLNRSIRENIGLASLKMRSRLGVIRSGWDSRNSEHHAAAVSLSAPNLSVQAGTLSGGNQQKVMIARWLAADPSVLILDEPTRGIDVGSKAEIYRLIHQLAESGRAILMISSEIEEILSLSNRVVVMRDRTIAAEFVGSDITEQAVTRAAIVDTNRPVGASQGAPAASTHKRTSEEHR
ncbi:sugar ABC transporter ATP-binding protein [Aeromicrobium sp.]|uniref:sugar ABC transporter ATP-binding protein n=1 Tax=Aeromicrobium sp. TaxID=1871063 RepID=UPI00199299D2|nr:sugar ABC transporter ATP-binding protein [Aeromicrobium sp.]MBC7633608.1 sugar ABC transporter ATP-binding protein [Aeromicrobium sp.]